MRIHEFEQEDFPFRYLGIILISDIEINLTSMLKKVNEISEIYNIRIQAFNLDNVVSLDHVIIASYHANKAIRNKTNLSKTIDVEFLLYLSCQRQIKLALEKFGVKDGKLNVGICLFGKNSSNFSKIKGILEEYLKSKELTDLRPPTKDKILKIISLMDISSEEIRSQLEDADISKEIKLIEKSILNKMAILSLEK